MKLAFLEDFLCLKIIVYVLMLSVLKLQHLLKITNSFGVKFILFQFDQFGRLQILLEDDSITAFDIKEIQMLY
jgi:hypothetical protein